MINIIDEYFETYSKLPDYKKRTYPEFSDLLGKTIKKIDYYKNNALVFYTVDDHFIESKYFMLHQQDCCENVYIEDISGNLEDLIDSPITLSDCSTNSNENVNDYSQTWTFYKLATIKGFVDIRWLGESNGFYSESVDFIKINNILYN